MGDRTGLTRLDRTNGYDDGRGYMRAKKTKLAQQNEQIRDALRHRNATMRTELFKGISINVNGRTQPTADELKRLILLNGGDYHPYYRYQTTKFMIATNLSMARIKTLRPDDRIVRPEWITDSIKAKCILPYQDYQLFDDSSTKEVQLQLTDGNSNSSTTSDQPLRITSGAASSRQVSNASTVPNLATANRNKNDRTSNNDHKGSKHQTTLEGFVIRGASRPKLDETKQQKPSTSKGMVDKNNSKPNDIKSCFARQEQKKKNIANICGLTSIDEIINLVNEWVGCPEGIQDADTACVTKYFYDLMNEKDYHNKFYEVIYALQQRVILHGDKRWIDLYNNMVETLKAELNHGGEASQDLCQLITMIEPASRGEESSRNQESKVDVQKIEIPVINIDSEDDDATREYDYDSIFKSQARPESNA